MRIAIGQLACGRDLGANRDAVAALARAAAGADLIALPEYSQAFDPRQPPSELAEPLDGPFVSLLLRLARETGATILAGMLERAPDAAGGSLPFNTAVAASPSGELDAYRKIHLYDRYGGREPEWIRPGAEDAPPLVVRVADARVGVMTCFDLRFGESAARLADAGADVIVVPAAWAAGPDKVDHWRTLLRARAIEHRCWAFGAGMAGRGVIGHSIAIDPAGHVTAEADGEPHDGPAFTADTLG